MKIKTRLKTLPLIAALTLGMALVPSLAQAKGDDRGQQHEQHSQSKGKQQHNNDRKAYSDRGHDRRDYDKHGRKYDKHERKHDKRHQRGNAYGHYKPVYHRPHYGHETHHVTNYVVRERVYRDEYIDLSDLRFMIGLHTGNLDIILRQ